MKLFIRCHGEAFDRDTLTDFVDRGLRGPWYKGFRARGEVVACRIVRVMDLAGRRVEYHGLVEVRPARIGWYLIQRLQGRPLQGRPVQVRKWFERSAQGMDRRQLGGLAVLPAERERRRVADRRRLVRVQLLDTLPPVITRQPARARR